MLEVIVRGRFRVLDRQGKDRTPKGKKEKGVIALLALSPDFFRSRAWLQDKLWSDRDGEKAQASLRRALANIRTSLGPETACLGADRTDVWLAKDCKVSFQDGQADPQRFLENLDIPDPEFESWLRLHRSIYDETNVSAVPAFQQNPSEKVPHVIIMAANAPTSPEHRFLTDYFCSALAEELNILGSVSVKIADGVELNASTPAPNTSVIELDSVLEDDVCFLQVRIRSGFQFRQVWSGRFRLGLAVAAAWESPELAAFMIRIVQAFIERTGAGSQKLPFYKIQSAARRLYTGSLEDLESAKASLQPLLSNDTTGIALAWYGFAKLTEILEFPSATEQDATDAIELTQRALDRAEANPMVTALAAQVHLKFNADKEYGIFLSAKAMNANDQNPYVLDAVSQAQQELGREKEGYRLALWAQQSADSLPNSFVWDMQCCLSALALGKLDDAISHAHSCHYKMPFYRPPLRYLVAILLIRGRHSEALAFFTRLKRLETSLTPQAMAETGYPFDTLRRVGLMDAFVAALKNLEI